MITKKNADDICAEIELYLKKRTGIPVPSLEDFCISYGYNESTIRIAKSGSNNLENAIKNIYIQAISTLEKFLILDTSMMEFKSDDKTYKLDKKCIMYQLKLLKSGY